MDVGSLTAYLNAHALYFDTEELKFHLTACLTDEEQTKNINSPSQAGTRDGAMPKDHPTPLSGGDRKALQKELAKSRGMTVILAQRAEQLRAEGEVLIRKADRFTSESWNEKMWSAGGPADPSPTIGQAINGGFPWLEVECSRCKTMSSVDLAALNKPQDVFIHDLGAVLRCRKCRRAGKRPEVILHQLTSSRKHVPQE